MRIMAGSLERVADTFLHAGYISGYPRPFNSYYYGNSQPKLELDMVDALRLKGEVLAGAAQLPERITAAVASSGSGDLLRLALTMTAGLVLLCFAWAFFRRAGRWRLLAPGIAAALLFFTPHCGDNEAPLPEVPPWQGKQLQQYENPQLATKALLHGLIADALVNIGRPVSSLANIQNEVGVPRGKPSSGLKYAIAHYGVDGWGKELRFGTQGGQYLVSSAGADGIFGNTDDLKLQIGGCSDSTWDSRRYGHFLHRESGEILLLIHRWTGDHFKYNDQARASRLTGGDLFDVLPQKSLHGKQLSLAKASYDKAAAKAKHTPLLLHVF